MGTPAPDSSRRAGAKGSVRKRILITLGALAAQVVALFIVALVLYQTGKVDEWAERQIHSKLAEMNIRTDVGHVAITLGSRAVDVQNIALYAGDETEPFLSAEHVHVTFEIVSLLAARVELKSVDVTNPVVNVRFDDGTVWTAQDKPDRAR